MTTGLEMLEMMKKINIDNVRNWIKAHRKDKYSKLSKLIENNNLELDELSIDIDKIVEFKDNYLEEKTIYFIRNDKEYKIIGAHYKKTILKYEDEIKKIVVEDKSSNYLTLDYVQSIYLKLLLYGNEKNISNGIAYLEEIGDSCASNLVDCETRLSAINEERERYINKISYLISSKCLKNKTYMELLKLEQSIKNTKFKSKKNNIKKNNLLEMIRLKKRVIQIKNSIDIMENQSTDIKILVSNNYDNMFFDDLVFVKK